MRDACSSEDMTMSNLVKYGGYSEEDAENDRKEIGTSEFWKPSVGKNVIRFLPPLPGKKALNTYFQHYVQLETMERGAGFACPRMAKKGACLVCDQADRLKGSGHGADFKRAKELFPKRRTLASVINRRNPDGGPVIYAFGKGVHEDLIALRTADKADFTDPVEGYDVMIERKGEGLKTEYRVIGSRNTTPLSQDAAQINDWITNQPDLARYCVVPSQEEILEILGMSAEDIQRIGVAAQAAAGKKGKSAAVGDAIDADFDEVPF